MAQTEVLQYLEVCRTDNVMCLVDKHKLEARWIELLQPIAGRYALYGSYGDVGRA